MTFHSITCQLSSLGHRSQNRQEIHIRSRAEAYDYQFEANFTLLKTKFAFSCELINIKLNHDLWKSSNFDRILFPRYKKFHALTYLILQRHLPIIIWSKKIENKLPHFWETIFWIWWKSRCSSNSRVTPEQNKAPDYKSFFNSMIFISNTFF